MSARGRKRKVEELTDEEYNMLVALGDPNRAVAAPAAPATPAKRSRKSGSSSTPAEKRLARVRNSCPQNILDRVIRVMSQRFYMISRSRNGQDLREEFKVLGSTGNVYTVVVDKLPSCDCPDARKGNHCKHILFVMLKVLAVPQSSTLFYQKALLSSELEQLFANAPDTSSSTASASLRSAFEKATGKKAAEPESESAQAGGSQQRLEEGDDCGICFEEMDVNKLGDLTFCETCNKPVHKACFSQWARTGRALTCVYCRSPWHDTSVAAGAGSSSSGTVTSEGYLNLAGAAGVSTVRDTSTYYDGPRRGQGWGRFGGYGYSRSSRWSSGYYDDY